jgi:DNA-directed RNA polymerase subunit M/transcription elongation factor TFIIS
MRENIMFNKEEKWVRNCPKCGNEITYTRIYDRDIAEKWNRNCASCANTGRIFSEETRKILSEFHKGQVPWNKGIKLTEEHKKNIGKSCGGRIFSDEHKQNLKQNSAHYWKGKTRSEESNKKRRVTTLKNIEERCGQISPNYNKIGCEIIRWFNTYYDFNFQHAENGGEVCIDGYFPDGVDERRKTIIEVDEKHHFDSDGTLKSKDVTRQRYLEGLGYKFIRVRV